MFRQFESTFLKHQAGLLPEALWQGFSNGARYTMNRPGWVQCWSEVRGIYSNDFRAFMDRAVNQSKNGTPTA